MDTDSLCGTLRVTDNLVSSNKNTGVNVTMSQPCTVPVLSSTEDVVSSSDSV